MKKLGTYLFSIVSIVGDKAKFLHTRSTDLFILPLSHKETNHITILLAR